MSKISFVYFDVGGVMIQDFSDTNKWDLMISNALGIPVDLHQQFDELYDKYEDDICEGKIHVDDLKSIIKEKFNPLLPDEFSLLKYFVNNFLPNESIWEIVHELKKKTKIGLLTDQYLDMFRLIKEHGLLPSINWDVVIDSSVVKVRKPKKEIFLLAQEKAHVSPSDILFIDNREKNLIPARELGWQTYLYDSRDYQKANLELSQFLKNHF